MTRYLTGLAVALAAAYPAFAAEWQPDYQASSLTFSATQRGDPFQGAFGDFQADIVFDPADPSSGSLSVAVDVTSIDTGDERRDGTLAGEAWFDFDAYTTATYVADSFRHEGGETYVAEGELTIRDITMAIDLPFTLTIEGDRAIADGGVTLQRLEYGLGEGQFASDSTVGHAVEVTFHLESTRVD